MSELYAKIHALFDKPAACKFVAQGLAIARDQSLDYANAHFSAQIKKNLFSDDAPHPEKLVTSGREIGVTLVYPPSADEKPFVKALASLGASAMLVEANETRTGEFWSYGYLKGRKSAYDKALKTIAAINPTLALGIAVEAGQAGKAKKLIAEGASSNGRLGRVPLLSIAAAAGRAPLLDLLLKAGADVNAVTDPLGSSEVTGDDYIGELTKDGFWTPYYSDVRTAGDARPLDDGNTALHDAAKHQHADCVRLLLDAGAEVNARNRHLQTPLLAAATNPDADTLSLLIDSGADIDARDFYGNTPIMILASGITITTSQRQDHVDRLLAPLIDRGADLGIENRDGATARGGASAREVIEALDRHNAPFKPGARCYTGDIESDIDEAIRRSDVRKFEELIQSNTFDRQEALCKAAWYGATEIIDLLMAAGADPDSAAGDELPVFAAARSGFVDAVAAICAAGADINRLDTQGRDVISAMLFRDADEDHIAVAEWALDNGWKPTVKAIHYAVQAVHADALIDKLLSHGADINAADDENPMTALHYAVQVHSRSQWSVEAALERVRRMLALGADVHARAHHGGTPLLVTGHHAIRKELLQAGADINARFADGKSPVCEACSMAKHDKAYRKQHEAEAMWWIENGVDLNVTVDYGMTPLMLAAGAESLTLVKAMLEAGADQFATNDEGKTALDAASAPWLRRSNAIRELLSDST